MGFDRVKIKQIYHIIVLCAVLIVGIIYIKDVLEMINIFFGVLIPFIIGGVIAFILNIPLSNIENKILKKWNGKAAKKLKRPVSILLSILFVALIVYVVIMTVVPQLAKTAADLGKKFPDFVDDIMNYLDKLSAKYPQIAKYVADIEKNDFDWTSITGNLVGFLKNGASDVLSSTFSVASGIIGGLLNFVIGLIFALYILGQKETLSGAIKKILKAYLKPKSNDKVLKVSKLLYVNFYNFITGQCLEALILGSLFVMGMFVCRLPYALLIGVLIAFLSLIPIVGTMCGCAVGAFLMLVDSPGKTVLFLIVFIVIQQVEGNLIYPKVVGNKVGLPPMLVLMAVTIGGSLFGVAGMLVFIPLVSTVFSLVRENVETRNKRIDKLK